MEEEAKVTITKIAKDYNETLAQLKTGNFQSWVPTIGAFATEATIFGVSWTFTQNSALAFTLIMGFGILWCFISYLVPYDSTEFVLAHAPIAAYFGVLAGMISAYM